MTTVRNLAVGLVVTCMLLGVFALIDRINKENAANPEAYRQSQVLRFL